MKWKKTKSGLFQQKISMDEKFEDLNSDWGIKEYAYVKSIVPDKTVDHGKIPYNWIPSYLRGSIKQPNIQRFVRLNQKMEKSLDDLKRDLITLLQHNIEGGVEQDSDEKIDQADMEQDKDSAVYRTIEKITGTPPAISKNQSHISPENECSENDTNDY